MNQQDYEFARRQPTEELMILTYCDVQEIKRQHANQEKDLSNLKNFKLKLTAQVSVLCVILTVAFQLLVRLI